MHFYSLPYEQALRLPLATFWMMSNNVNRINAEQDIRRIPVAAASQSQDAMKEVNRALKAELGDVVRRSADEGLDQLRSLAGRIRREEAFRRNTSE